MTTWRIVLEYDGTGYLGWQRQPTGRSIQLLVEQGLQEVLGGEKVSVFASGRTDSGVHAVGQVASFNAQTVRAPHAIRMGLNSVLPRDISCRGAEVAPEGFHACFHALSKTYLYRILDIGERSPLRERFVWPLRGPLNLDSMREAASSLLGTHDFKSFQGGQSDTRTTIRTLSRLDLARVDNELQITVSGTGFLRHMVRIMAGTLVGVGRGRTSPQQMTEILDRKDRSAAGFTAPACGLCLMEVLYPPDHEIPPRKRGEVSLETDGSEGL